MNELLWNSRMIELAAHISLWSKDPNRKVGAVLTRQNYRIVSTGFNGYASGVDDSDLTDKNKKIIHAEVNCLLNCTPVFSSLRMFIFGGHPCSSCASAIVNSSLDITSLICPQIPKSSSWKEDMELAKRILKSNKKLVVKYY